MKGLLSANGFWAHSGNLWGFLSSTGKKNPKSGNPTSELLLMATAPGLGAKPLGRGRGLFPLPGLTLFFQPWPCCQCNISDSSPLSWQL